MNHKFSYTANNHNALFNNREFVADLVKNIRIKLRRNLSKMEKRYVIDYLKQIDFNQLIDKPPQLVIDAISGHVSEEIANFSCQFDEEINIKEIQNEMIGVATDQEYYNDPSSYSTPDDFAQEIVQSFDDKINIVNFLGKSSISELYNSFNKSSNDRTKNKRVIINFDSRFRSLDQSDGTSIFYWNFINNEQVTDGTINAIGQIRNIVSLRITPFQIPYTESANNDYDRITLYIREFSSQSVIAHENRRYHFMFEPTKVGNWIKLNPFNYFDGYFEFRLPVIYVDSFTVSFGSPNEIITFDKDRLEYSITSYDTTTELTFVENHNLTAGDIIYFSDFTTLNPDSDAAIISNFNQSTGIMVTSITNDTTVEIDIDTSLITYPTFLGVQSFNNTSSADYEIGGIALADVGILSVGDYVFIEITEGFSTGTLYGIIVGLEPSTNQSIYVDEIELISLTGLLAPPVISWMITSFRRANDVIDFSATGVFASKRILFDLAIEYQNTDDN